MTTVPHKAARQQEVERMVEVMRHHRGILARLPDGPVKVAEVGCYRGKLSAALLKVHGELYLTMVDSWAAPAADSAYLSSGDRAARQLVDEADELYEESLANTAFANARRTVMRSTSLAAAAMLPDQTFDLVFIDADHTRHAVEGDLRVWCPKVKPGGWLGGHDYRYRPPKIEVKPAVDAFAAAHDLRVEQGGGTTWFIRVPSM